MLLGQQNRFLQIIGGLADIAVLSDISGEERLSRPYLFHATLLSSAHFQQLAAFIGKPLALRLGKAPDGRWVHGVLTELQQQGSDDGQHRYVARIEPWLQTLTLTRNLKVYQRVSVPDMVCDILRKRGVNDIELALKGHYPPREYCMQYKESDFDFITRQLEDAGIFYFFRHETRRHQLVLADHPSAFTSTSPATLPYQSTMGTQQGYGLRAWQISHKMIPGVAQINGYNPQNATPISASAQASQGSYADPKLSIYDDRPVEARSLLASQATLCMEQWESQSHYAQANSNHPGLQVGQQFTLQGHSDADGRYVVGQQTLQAKSNLEQEEHFSAQVTLLPATRVFRPQPSVARPHIAGILSAVVVGAASEEIHTDPQGRIKIQFLWDQTPQKNGDSSCWIRVSQSWNGAKFGTQFLPLVGSEVLVSFVDGDPDNPVVIGSVYNGVKTPPFALPAQKTQSGLTTRTTTQGTIEQGYTLCFEDKTGEEFIRLQSEKDLQLRAKNDFFAQINRNVAWEILEKRDAQINKGHDTLILDQGDAITQLKQGSKKQTLERGDYTLSVAKGGAKISLGQTCTISANRGIELQVGNSKLSITPTGISISAATITLNAGGSYR